MTTYLRLMSAALLVTTVTACGDFRDAHDERMTEEETLRLDGTGEDNPEGKASVEAARKLSEPSYNAGEVEQIMAKYRHLDPNHVVPSGLLKKAVLYYEGNRTKLGNVAYLSVIDFARNSSEARFFIVNVADGSVWAIHTAHGKASDSDNDGFATAFSNLSGSNKSSLGYYLTAETYIGGHGYSMRLDGLSSTNSNVRSRVIVIHPADYVKEKSVKMGRSLGCPAISPEISRDVIDRIKGGSIIYAGRSSV